MLIDITSFMIALMFNMIIHISDNDRLNNENFVRSGYEQRYSKETNEIYWVKIVSSNVGVKR